MKKQNLFLIPFLLLLACKKKETPAPPIDPTVKVDMSTPFKGLILTDYRKTIEAQMTDRTSLGYPGYITEISSIQNKTLSPFSRVQIANCEFVLKDINDVLLAKKTIEGYFILSTFSDECKALTSNINKVLSPKISYELYASEDIEYAAKTELTLVIKAVYFYAELNPLKDEHLKFSPGAELNQIKESGAYLSRIGYGTAIVYNLSSDQSPKKLLPYLKAYLNDHLNNKGANSKDLKDKIIVSTPSKTFYGGDTNTTIKYLGLPVTEAIESVFKNEFAPQSYRHFAKLEFKFKSLKDNKEIN